MMSQVVQWMGIHTQAGQALWVNEEIGWWSNCIGNSAKIDFLTCDPSTPCNY